MTLDTIWKQRAERDHKTQPEPEQYDVHWMISDYLYKFHDNRGGYHQVLVDEDEGQAACDAVRTAPPEVKLVVFTGYLMNFKVVTCTACTLLWQAHQRKAKAP